MLPWLQHVSLSVFMVTMCISVTMVTVRISVTMVYILHNVIVTMITARNRYLNCDGTRQCCVDKQ